jgi:hypothetical protein
MTRCLSDSSRHEGSTDDPYTTSATAKGNPDFGEDPAKVFGEATFTANTVEEISRLFRAWIDKHGFGDGSVGSNNIVMRCGRPVNRISYNGRIWPLEARVSEIETCVVGIEDAR